MDFDQHMQNEHDSTGVEIGCGRYLRQKQGPFQSHEISKARDLCLEFSSRFKIWQAARV